MVRLSVFLKAKIIVLWEQGTSIKEITRILGIAVSIIVFSYERYRYYKNHYYVLIPYLFIFQQRNTVRSWIRRYQETGDVQCNRSGPRPVVYTDEFERHRNIVSIHTESPFASTRATATLHNISLMTVRRHLHAAGIHNYKPAKKIKLSDAHRQARVAFARQYSEFDWENKIVIFTDEKSFRSDKDGRKILWRRPGDRYDPNNVLPLRTSGRITLGR